MKNLVGTIALTFVFGACSSGDDGDGGQSSTLGKNGKSDDAQASTDSAMPIEASDSAANTAPATSDATAGAHVSSTSAAASGDLVAQGAPGTSQASSSNTIITAGNVTSNVNCVSVGSNNTSIGAGAIGGSFSTGDASTSGCTGDGGTQKAVLATEQRQVGAFSGVVLTDGLIGELSVDPQAVVLKLDQDLIARVQTVVHAGTLEVGDGDPGASLHTSSEARVLISSPTLTSVSAREAASWSGAVVGDVLDLEAIGAGSLNLTLQISDALSITTRDAGKATLDGSAKSVAVNAAGGSTVTSNASATSADVTASGAAKVTVFASSSVRINASGAASVTVLGNPTTRQVAASPGAKVQFTP